MKIPSDTAIPFKRQHFVINGPSISNKMQGDRTPVRGATMFTKVDALPCVERRLAAHDRDRQADPGQDRLEVGGHRDRPQYGTVIGVSLGAAETMRLRRRRDEGGFERFALPLRPREAYLLDGPARREWEHSIAPVESARWSVTFRTLRDQPALASSGQ